jgi:hypothetical protein
MSVLVHPKADLRLAPFVSESALLKLILPSVGSGIFFTGLANYLKPVSNLAITMRWISLVPS